jgi:hypothetical protein
LARASSWNLAVVIGSVEVIVKEYSDIDTAAMDAMVKNLRFMCLLNVNNAAY